MFNQNLKITNTVTYTPDSIYMHLLCIMQLPQRKID